MKKDDWLSDYSQDVHSQCGEDGILREIINLINHPEPGFCIEFGAGNGLEHSNTRNLITARGWSSIQIEADPARYSQLFRLYEHSPDVKCSPARVGWAVYDSLDAIVEGMGVPQCFDLLSIDIDGNDYHAWRAITHYRPKIVVIEFNPTFPPWIDWVQSADQAVNHGCSLAALVRLGKDKGYELVAATAWNAIFVDRDFFPLFEISDNRPERLWQHWESLLYIAKGYDGSLIPVGFPGMIWSRNSINLDVWAKQIQVMPPEQRVYNGRVTTERTGK